VAIKPKNEKEIQIQRVSSSPALSNEPVQSNSNQKLAKPINSQSLSVSAASPSSAPSQPELTSKSSNFVDVPSKTPVNVSNTAVNVANNDKQSTNNPLNMNVQAIAATVAASIESATAKAKQQQQNAQMNSKILATLNSKIQQQQQKQVIVPQFHFPNGKPDEKQFKDDPETMKLVSAEFRLQKDAKIYKETFADIMKIIGLPRYWKTLLFRACTLNNKLNYITYSSFEQTWAK